MNRKLLYWFCFLCCFFFLQAKSQTQDTSRQLTEVLLKGFQTHQTKLLTPASVELLQPKDLNRFSTHTLVAAMNVLPGVRMEERSPGSYRLSIRGSLLRSPFGVRNVKVYIDELPFTDASGNTYLNLIDPQTITQIDVLKGPASSLFGAGTGGALLISSPSPKWAAVPKHRSWNLTGSMQGGSFGLFSAHAGASQRNIKGEWHVRFAHVQQDGYRNNSTLRKDVLQVSGFHAWHLKDSIRFYLLLADLYYQTPGGLTLEQWNADPKQARPAAGNFRSAADQKAAVYNQTLFAGLTNTWHIHRKLIQVISLTGSYTNFKNPFITNVETRGEWSAGVRATWKYATSFMGLPSRWLAGGEWQITRSDIHNYGNQFGRIDTLQSFDQVSAVQYFGFFQGDVDLTKALQFNVGVSYNKSDYAYRRRSSPTIQPTSVSVFPGVWSPRLALRYALKAPVSLRFIVSKGFSAPTLAEIRPSDGLFYTSLEPESGWNQELGMHALFLKNRIEFDLALYDFRLNNTIVRRNSAAGTEYFVNAGNTVQRGLEAATTLHFPNALHQAICINKAWINFTYQPYRYEQYQMGNSDFSGKAIPGVPPTVWDLGCEGTLAKTGFWMIHYQHCSTIELNDANSVHAGAYDLLQCKLGYRKKINKVGVEFYIGADNLLNQRYSLGNDLNAAGNRFYNAAPPRNCYAGLRMSTSAD